MPSHEGFSAFGKRVFDKEKMAQFLSKKAYNELIEIMDTGGRLNRELADQVAHAMKEWALSNGATHFTHWFQPMRGVTAEKHDSFLSLEDGHALERFSGGQLFQSEPDASSFPSGGMRSTFEARGYTAWDPTSPAYLLLGQTKTTLVIPSVFFSYKGEVLDLKRPLLRSLKVLEKRAYKILKKFGNRTVRHVKATVGAEQEFFLIDKEFFQNRLDLLLCSRTLLGAPSPKGQQFDDHYFGHIKPKVLAFMEDVDSCLFERGIAYKTRHNEVAPNQFEFAPTFVDANLGVDWNLQMMEIMRHVADDHGFALLLHEKPFAGVNGSGKHLNWSMQDSDGNNLLEPQKKPKRNAQFLVFLCAVLIGVQKFGGLLRASIADAGNDHRLGANEAPPAVMSVFLGEGISKMLNAIADGKDLEQYQGGPEMKIGMLQGICFDSTDRNRTSPVAFTGNKFEFRAVGASHNVSKATTVLNMITAYGLDEMDAKLDKYLDAGDAIYEAAIKAVREAVNESRACCFEGNNYDPEWLEKAASLGLPVLKNTPEALKVYLTPEVVELYEGYKVLSKHELEARVEVRRETYAQIKLMELGTLQEMARTLVMPALTKQLESYAITAATLDEGAAQMVLKKKLALLESILVDLDTGLELVAKVHKEAEEMEDDIEKMCDFLGEKGVEALDALRAACDAAELETDDDLWKIPKYSDMLHII